MWESGKHSVIFLIEDKGRLLLEKRLEPDDKYFGYTIIPGGGVEEGESVHEALEREVMEEFGVAARRYRPIGIIETKGSAVLHIRHVFLINDLSGEPTNKEVRNEQLKVSPVEARRLCAHPISQRVLDLYDDYLTRIR